MQHIVAYNGDGGQIESFSQWDMNHKVYFHDIKVSGTPYIHFFNKNTKEAYSIQASVGSSNKEYYADVPNILLQEHNTIFVIIYEIDSSENTATSLYICSIPVKRRAKPSNYAFKEDVNFTSITDLKLDIENALNEYSEQIETIKNDTINEIQLSLNEKIDGAYVEDGYLFLTSNGEVVVGNLGPFSGTGGGGGGGTGNNATMSVTNATGWLSHTIADGDNCEIKLNWSSTEDEIPTGNGTLKVTVNGILKATIDVNQGLVITDITKYLSSGTNIVKMNISDVYGNNRTINFNVSSVSISITSTFDSSIPYTDSILFSYTPVGSIKKNIHFILDNNEIGTVETSVSNRQMTYTIPKQSHGAHTLQCYFTCDVNGQEVSSNTLYYEIICLGNIKTPIIVSPFNKNEAQQYETIHIPYTVYDPSELTKSITISVNNKIVSELTVDRTEQTFNYRPDTSGTIKIKIVAGSVSKDFTINVTETDINIEAETDQLVLYLTSSGRNNNEENPSNWAYNDIEASLTDFNYVSNGWINDNDGITSLRVSGDSRVEIPYKPFATDFRTTGKTIEIEFATRDVMDYDTTIVSCVSGKRGFSLTPQKAILKSEQTEIFTQYKEDEHVRISFVVEKRSENRLIYCYINGIMSGCKQYVDNDDFSQTNPVSITIGSNDCVTDIYNIRVYNNDLTRQQILNNWIADTQNITDLLSRYQRNNIYDEYGNIVISKLQSDLPYLILKGSELPQFKGDKKTIDGSYVDPITPSKSFTFTGAQIDVQGTSSQYYARKNFKTKFKGGFILNNGTHSDSYAIRIGSIPVSTFTYKADVASSEGANNVELVRLYNDTCPYKTPAQKKNSAVRQGIDGFPIVIFWDDGESVTFLGKYNFNNDKGTEEVFGFEDGDESWEILNNTSNRVLWKSADYTSTIIENGKSTPAWLNDFEARFPDTDPVYTNYAQLKEFADFCVSTDTTQATNTPLPSTVTYKESQIVEGETKEVDVSYTNDTEAYRLAKFKNEIGNYVELDSALFYYLFTELFLMIDSRAKNAFPSFIGGAI